MGNRKMKKQWLRKIETWSLNYTTLNKKALGFNERQFQQMYFPNDNFDTKNVKEKMKKPWLKPIISWPQYYAILLQKRPPVSMSVNSGKCIIPLKTGSLKM